MMAACWDSGSDSEPHFIPSTVQRRRHSKVVLSDSDTDTPPTAAMQRGMIPHGHAAQQLPSPHPSLHKHMGRVPTAGRPPAPALSSRHAASLHAVSVSASLLTQRKAQPAAAENITGSMSQMQICDAAAVPAQPAEEIIDWPDASSPGLGVASGMHRTVPRPASSAAQSCSSSGASSSRGLVFTRSTQRGAQRLALSDSESEASAHTAPLQARLALHTPAAAALAGPVRRLSFAAAPLPGFQPAGSTDSIGEKAAPTQQPRASVRWADDAAAGPESSLLTALHSLQLEAPQPSPPAAADVIVDLCLSPQPDPVSSPGSPEEEPSWTATHTPRRRRAVLSDSSDSEAAGSQPEPPAASPPSPTSSVAASPVSPAAGAASPASSADCSVPVTPWRCTPPWQFSVSRPQPATAPAVHRPTQPASPPASLAAVTPAAGQSASPAAATTPLWMSAYKRPPAAPVEATRSNLVAIEAAAKPAAPRPRRQSVRPPPEVITLSSSEDEADEPLLATPAR